MNIGLGARGLRFQLLQETASELKMCNAQQAPASDGHFGICATFICWQCSDSTPIVCVSRNELVVGWDMSKWKTENHFVSWLKLSPDNKISGGKIIVKGRMPTNTARPLS